MISIEIYSVFPLQFSNPRSYLCSLLRRLLLYYHHHGRILVYLRRNHDHDLWFPSCLGVPPRRIIWCEVQVSWAGFWFFLAPSCRTSCDTARGHRAKLSGPYWSEDLRGCRWRDARGCQATDQRGCGSFWVRGRTSSRGG